MLTLLSATLNFIPSPSSLPSQSGLQRSQLKQTNTNIRSSVPDNTEVLVSSLYLEMLSWEDFYPLPSLTGFFPEVPTPKLPEKDAS